ncbi:hypothetical protein T4D_4833 [Trichinella pseudospiralis]|uniref:Uncharacterized protein n=1 Tax=Trichinella pseudospiralis TaxID=6337 RepID=A0A0V1F7V4_TRIPS|nr:hypothetical protein T4D_4833 [Trichinella pseudospiralis]
MLLSKLITNIVVLQKANICAHFSYRAYSDDDGVFYLRIFVCIETTREMWHSVPLASSWFLWQASHYSSV